MSKPWQTSRKSREWVYILNQNIAFLRVQKNTKIVISISTICDGVKKSELKPVSYLLHRKLRCIQEDRCRRTCWPDRCRRRHSDRGCWNTHSGLYVVHVVHNVYGGANGTYMGYDVTAQRVILPGLLAAHIHPPHVLTIGATVVSSLHGQRGKITVAALSLGDHLICYEMSHVWM